jgi:hypothetical protein
MTLNDLSKANIAVTLFDACRQTEDQKRCEQAYTELFRYLYRAAYNRWPDLAEDVTQHALLLVHQHIARCANPAAFRSFGCFSCCGHGSVILVSFSSAASLAPSPPVRSVVLAVRSVNTGNRRLLGEVLLSCCCSPTLEVRIVVRRNGWLCCQHSDDQRLVQSW